MEKVEVEISFIVQTRQNYHIILKEKHGKKRLPILIGGFEGRVIIWTLENIELSRPLTHDLMLNALDLYGIDIIEAVITKVENNIFFAELILEKDGEIKKLDSRASDAIALALKKNIPIFINKKILDELGFDLSEMETKKFVPKIQKEETEKHETSEKQNFLAKKSVKELKMMLQKAIDEENYEFASVIRDELKRRENEQK